MCLCVCVWVGGSVGVWVALNIDVAACTVATTNTLLDECNALLRMEWRIGNNCWQNDYDEAVQLHGKVAEIAYVSLSSHELCDLLVTMAVCALVGVAVAH